MNVNHINPKEALKGYYAARRFSNCEGCDLYLTRPIKCPIPPEGSCMRKYRADNRNVIFKKIEALKRPKKEFVWVGVWHIEADDPVVFASKTLHGLDLQIYDAIKEYFRQIFQGGPVPKGKSKAIEEYFQRCSDQGIAEWILTTKEEIK